MRFLEDLVFNGKGGHDLRFFIRVRETSGRYGMWAMRPGGKGVFFHGDREECQAVNHTIEDLVRLQYPAHKWEFRVIEITRAAAIANLVGWTLAITLFEVKPDDQA